ncbi:MAG: hypothetical protein O3A92_05575 [Verrucomicrobia bacterium]|nr:hypothetical protein [Verrucomicrobiota bacterium]
MKRTITMVLGTMLALCASSGADTASEDRANKVAGLYQQGVSALEDGDGKLAAECFREVLALQPTHGNARYQLLSLQDKKPSLAAKVRERKLSQVKIPKVDFDGTTFAEAIEALDILVVKETAGEFAPNFIIQDPHGILEKSEITMKLGAVPASVILDYVLKMANAKARNDEHAIVLIPLGIPPKAAVEGEGAGKPTAKDPFGG